MGVETSSDIARRVSANEGNQVRKALAVVLLTWFAAAGGGNSPTAPSGSMASASVAGTWAGRQGRMPGSFLGTMSGDDMTFTMDMPTSSMTSSGCSSRATGTAHVNRTTMTMTGTYSGSNSCSGAFAQWSDDDDPAVTAFGVG